MFLLPASHLATQQSADIVVRDVTVIDCKSSKPHAHQDVLIANGMIIRIAETGISDQARTTVDGRGKYLIPGLWDMHVHGTAIPGFLGIYLANGVTGVRDMFDPSGSTIKLEQSIEKGDVLGPHIVAAGKIIDGPKPIWPGSLTASDGAEGIKAANDALAQGSDFLKVYSLLPKDAFFSIAGEARKRHVTFAGHVPESVSAQDATEAGMHSMEHLYGILRACSAKEEGTARVNIFGLPPEKTRMLYRSWINDYDTKKAARLFSAFQRNDTYQCPTLTVLYSLTHPLDKRADIQGRFDYLPAWMRNMWSGVNPAVQKWNEDDKAIRVEMFQRDLRLVGDMSKAGVRILAGTDVMNPYCMPGFSLHDELKWLVQAGMTPFKALQAATLNPALYLHREGRFGTVEAGKVADLVLLSANPLQDIGNTTKIESVILGGKLLDAQQLKTLMPKNAKGAMKIPPYVAAFGSDGD